MPAFSTTRFAALIAVGLCYAFREPLLQWWLAPLLEQALRDGAEVSFPDDTGIVFLRLKVVVVTSSLLTFPVFCADAWLLLCRWRRNSRGAALALPFALSSASVLLLGFWWMLNVEFTFFRGPCF